MFSNDTIYLINSIWPDWVDFRISFRNYLLNEKKVMAEDMADSSGLILLAEKLRKELDSEIGKPITPATKLRIVETANKLLKLKLAKLIVESLEPYIRSQGKYIVVWELPIEVMANDFKVFDFGNLELIFCKVNIETIKDNVVITAYY